MESIKNVLVKFFGVAGRGQTYLNALYLLLAFPLGLFYFIFLVVGISLGIPLMIIWVGLMILLLVFGIWYALIAFERELAIGLLREDIPPMLHQDLAGKTLGQKFSAVLANPVTWKGLVYLIAKFPLGLLSFVVLVTSVSLSGALLATPLYYQWAHPNIGLTWNGVYWDSLWVIDSLSEALLASLAGVFVALISMHLLNGLAWVSGKFARIMLGNFSIPAAPGPQEPNAPALAG